MLAFAFDVNISSVTLYLIKGLLYQETERSENLQEKDPMTRKPFAAHLRVVSSFLPHRLLAHITYFIIQHNSNKNNKQALQYSANNFTIKDQELITTDLSIILKQFALKRIFVYNIAL